MWKVEEKLKPVLSGLKKGLGDRLAAVALFGSRARGDAMPQSDWDIFVLAEGLPDKPFRRHLLLKRMIPPRWRGKVSIIAKTPEEFERYLAGLFLDIAVDGVILFDPQGYLSQKLDLIRRLIKQKGLTREKRGRDLIWRWKRYPGPNWSIEWSDIDDKS